MRFLIYYILYIRSDIQKETVYTMSSVAILIYRPQTLDKIGIVV